MFGRFGALVPRWLRFAPLLVGFGCATHPPETAPTPVTEPSPAAAAPRTPMHEAPPLAASDADGEAVGGGTDSPDHEPEVVHTGKTWKLKYAAASARFQKGKPCSADDAPDYVLGKADKRNEMAVGYVRVVTYGFRYKEGTLVIRCRDGLVESMRTLR
jgi:hypothetical protein